MTADDILKEIERISTEANANPERVSITSYVDNKHVGTTEDGRAMYKPGDRVFAIRFSQPRDTSKPIVEPLVTAATLEQLPNDFDGVFSYTAPDGQKTYHRVVGQRIEQVELAPCE